MVLLVPANSASGRMPPESSLISSRSDLLAATLQESQYLRGDCHGARQEIEIKVTTRRGVELFMYIGNQRLCTAHQRNTGRFLEGQRPAGSKSLNTFATRTQEETKGKSGSKRECTTRKGGWVYRAATQHTAWRSRTALVGESTRQEAISHIRGSSIRCRRTRWKNIWRPIWIAKWRTVSMATCENTGTCGG